MKTEVKTRSFEFAHGKKPRGFGSWAFTFDNDQTPWWAPTSTYGDAVKAAKVEAGKRGAWFVEVCS